MFFDRENIIETYKSKIEIFLSGKWQNTYNLAFLGLRRTGKTFLIKELLNHHSKDIHTFYFDLSNLNTTPLNFSNEIIYKLFSGIDSKNYSDLDEIRIGVQDKDILDAIKNHQNIIKKWTNFQIIDSTFNIITVLSKHYKLIIAFDEFQDLLDFRNFKDLKNIDSMFRSHLLNQNNVFYIISWSYPEIIKDLILNPRNKLYSHFEVFEIWNFDKKTSLLYSKYLNPDLDTKTQKNLFDATNWNPYLLSILSPKIVNPDSFDDIIKKELFNNKWQIYNHFLYILESSISKIWKTWTMNAILKEISINESMKIIDLSNELWISSQLILKELKKLKNISILFRDNDKNIKFRDYLFRFFCYYYYSWYETFELDSGKYYKDKIEELENKLSKTLSELGKTKEFELYYEIKENQGTLWKWIELPKFNIIKKNYYTEFWDELDLYAETMRWKMWVFELKYKTKQIWNKEIEKFLNKIKSDKYVYISKSWFSDNIDEKYIKNKDLSLISLD